MHKRENELIANLFCVGNKYICMANIFIYALFIYQGEEILPITWQKCGSSGSGRKRNRNMHGNLLQEGD